MAGDNEGENSDGNVDETVVSEQEEDDEEDFADEEEALNKDNFLNLNVDKIGFTLPVKAVVDNVLMHFGEPKPAQRTEVCRKMLIDELLGMIGFAAKLMKNSEEKVALLCR